MKNKRAARDSSPSASLSSAEKMRNSIASPATHKEVHGTSAQSNTTHGVAAEGWSAGSRAARVHRARGFSLVAALFLLVVVAALGAFAVRIGASQQQTVNLALLNAKALAAANSGIEYGAQQALTPPNICSNVTLNLTEAGLNGFTVAVTCAGSAHAESGGTANIYRIDATSSLGTYGTPDYVSRHVFATFTSMP